MTGILSPPVPAGVLGEGPPQMPFTGDQQQDGTKVAYCIEGTVTFEDLEVLRADATPQPLEEFMSGGHRCWQALHGRNERLSVEAQRTAQDGTPSWRPYVRTTVTISGSDPLGTG